MESGAPVRVRFFGALRELRKQRGLPLEDEIWVPSEGRSAREIARSLSLPAEKIEGVFCNHTIRDLGQLVLPGDEIAFVPPGTPGPHRYFLGLYEAGAHERRSVRDEDDEAS